MDCRSFRERLRRWLEAAWDGAVRSAELPEDLLRHSEGCSQCARRLATVLALQEPEGRPTADLVQRVTYAVVAAADRRPAQRWLERTWQGLRGGGRLVRASVTIGVAVMLIVTLQSLFRPQTVTVKLSFEAPGASHVTVVGDWNSWNPTADQLADPDGDGVWEIQLQLRRSTEPRYQFVVDGTWWSPDPKADLQVDDGFGGVSSVLQI